MTAAIALAALLVVAAGIAIGATSIGGILVLPALTGVVGIDVVTAVAATSFAFLATGVLTLLDLGRAADARAEVRRDLPLHGAALVGAGLGALAVYAVPAGWVKLWIALLALGSGLHAFATLRRAATKAPKPWPAGAALAAIGLAVGFGSGLSGTGGPILMLPFMILLGRALPRAVTAALVLQIPIALAATAVHVALGRLDLRLGLLVAAGLAGGAWLGRRVARRADALRLKGATAAVLVATGVGYAFA